MKQFLNGLGLGIARTRAVWQFRGLMCLIGRHRRQRLSYFYDERGCDVTVSWCWVCGKRFPIVEVPRLK